MPSWSERAACGLAFLLFFESAALCGAFKIAYAASLAAGPRPMGLRQTFGLRIANRARMLLAGADARPVRTGARHVCSSRMQASFGDELATKVVVSAIAGSLQQVAEQGIQKFNKWQHQQPPLAETLLLQEPVHTMAVEDYHDSLEQHVKVTLQQRSNVKYNKPHALLLRGAAESVIQTVVYTTSVEAYRSSSGFDQLPWTVQAAAGGLAGMHRALICCPWDVLTLKAQTHVNIANVTTTELLTDIGFGRMLTGLLPVWLVDAPQSMLWFPLFTWLNANVAHVCHNPLECCVIAGVSAALAGTIVVAPAEVIKSFLTSRQRNIELAQEHQQDSNWINNLDAEVPSVYEAARTLMQEGGIGGFFAGTGVRMAKMVPTMAVYLSSFTFLKSTFTVKLFTPPATPVIFAQVTMPINSGTDAGITTENVVILSPTAAETATAASTAATSSLIGLSDAVSSASSSLPTTATDVFPAVDGMSSTSLQFVDSSLSVSASVAEKSYEVIKLLATAASEGMAGCIEGLNAAADTSLHLSVACHNVAT